MSEELNSTEGAVESIKLAIKNPSRPGLGDFNITVPVSATILTVKQKLAEEYHDKPNVAHQTLIYGGKVLKDDKASLQSLLNLTNDQARVHSLHLVVKNSSSGSATTPPPPAAPRPGPAPQAGSSSAGPSSSGRQPTATPSGGLPPPQSAPQLQQPFLQAGYGNMWPTSQPDPSILAAYNAALESLRSRPPFPSFTTPPSASATSQGGEPLPQTSGVLPQQFVPPYSLAPTLVMPPGLGGPPGGQQGYAPFLRDPVSGLPPHLPAGASPASGGAGSSSQTPQQPGSAPQLFAPTLAYVPVNLVQSQQAGGEQRGGGPAGPSNSTQQQPHQQQQPQPHPMLPFPQFAAPIMPMMMPFGFQPYPPHMLQGHPNFPPGVPHQQPGRQPFQGVPPAPPPPPARWRQAQAPAQPQAQPAVAPIAPGVAAVAGARLVRPGMAPVRVRMIQLNIKLLAQLLFMGFFIYQSMPRNRFWKAVAAVAIAYFLWPIFNRDNALRRRIQGVLNPAGGRRAPGGHAAAAAGNAQPGGHGHPQQGGHGRQHGRGNAFLREAQALILGFFASLLPGFNMNAEDAAAFAAAQRVVEENEAGREHND